MPLLYLRELYVDYVGEVDREFVRGRDMKFVWPAAPNVRTLGVTLCDMEELALETIPIAYPDLEKLDLDLRAAVRPSHSYS
jgi:hypothetical protein